MLREVSNRELIGPGDMACEWRQPVRKQFDQCRLAVAIRSEQRNSVVAVDSQGHTVEYRIIPVVSDRDVIGSDDRGRQHLFRSGK